MSIDYMPDEMKRARNDDLHGRDPETVATFNAGWRAACEAWAERQAALSPPQPVAGWKADCHVECSGWSYATVRSSSGKHILTKQGTWISIDDPSVGDCFFYGSRDHPASINARAALDACQTPPPGMEDIK